MPNYSKLFSLDNETLEILKTKKNQSEFVRDAIKKANSLGEITEEKKELIVKLVGKT